MSIEHNHRDYLVHSTCPRCRLYDNAEALLVAAEKVLQDKKNWDSENQHPADFGLQAIIDKIRGKKGAKNEAGEGE